MAHPLPTNITGDCDGFLYCMARWTYDVSQGRAFVMFLLGFCIVLFIASQRFGTPRAFGFASVAGILGAIFLATMQLIQWWIASIFVIVGGLGFVVLIMNQR